MKALVLLSAFTFAFNSYALTDFEKSNFIHQVSFTFTNADGLINMANKNPKMKKELRYGVCNSAREARTTADLTMRVLGLIEIKQKYDKYGTTGYHFPGFFELNQVEKEKGIEDVSINIVELEQKYDKFLEENCSFEKLNQDSGSSECVSGINTHLSKEMPAGISIDELSNTVRSVQK